MLYDDVFFFSHELFCRESAWINLCHPITSQLWRAWEPQASHSPWQSWDATAASTSHWRYPSYNSENCCRIYTTCMVLDSHVFLVLDGNIPQKWFYKCYIRESQWLYYGDIPHIQWSRSPCHPKTHRHGVSKAMASPPARADPCSTPRTTWASRSNAAERAAAPGP